MMVFFLIYHWIKDLMFAELETDNWMTCKQVISQIVNMVCYEKYQFGKVIKL